MYNKEKENPVSNLMSHILNSNKQSEDGEEAIQMPELALRCAQFFHSLSQYCLYYYKNYNKQADGGKTKLIRKADKSKREQREKSKKLKLEEKNARISRGENEPQPPKKPLTAYIIYFQDKKPSFATRFPTLSLSELTKLIAKDWKHLEENEKQSYLERAAKDRRRYDIQKAEFREKYHRKQNAEEDQLNEQNQEVQADGEDEEAMVIQSKNNVKKSGTIENRRMNEEEQNNQSDISAEAESEENGSSVGDSEEAKIEEE